MKNLDKMALMAALMKTDLEIMEEAPVFSKRSKPERTKERRNHEQKKARMVNRMKAKKKLKKIRKQRFDKYIGEK